MKLNFLTLVRKIWNHHKANMNNIQWLIRKKFKTPIYITKYDTLTVTYYDKELIKSDIGNEFIFDEARIFEAKIDGKDSIGGCLMGKKIN